MPNKDKQKYKEYMSTYMRGRYQKRKKFCIEFLGGLCVKCGSIENLEFDHINPEDKEFTIADGMLWSLEKLIKELNKCQLLCKKCHCEKTLIDKGQEDAHKTHDTLSSVRYCKCDLCLEAGRKYNKERSKKHVSIV